MVVNDKENYLTEVEGYNYTKVSVELEFDDINDVTKDCFCCLSIAEYDNVEVTFLGCAGLSLESAIKLRDGLNKLIDTYTLKKEVIINKE